MKNKDEEIDKIIKETLSAEEAKFYDDLDEQGLLQMLGGLFKTKHWWLILIMNIITLAALVLMVYCVIEFLKTDDTNELIKWAAAGFVCLITVSMLKIFMWMQMDKNALLREIKRLELQVASASLKKKE